MAQKARTLVLFAAGLGLLVGSPALALINPTFTPVHLVKQSDLVLELRIEPAKGGKAVATVKRVVKGKAATKALTLDLASCAVKEQIEALEATIKSSKDAPAIFFAGGADPREGDAAQGDAKDKKAFLNMAGKWVALYGGAGDVWHVDGIDQQMLATWQGGTDMLVRAVDYILAEADADLPAREGVAWAGAAPQPFGKAPGVVHAAAPIDLAGDGKLVLFVASEGGDRLFQYDVKTKDLADVTAARALATKSIAAAWGDFDGDGRLDLVSWDGQTLALATQDAGGKFQPGRKIAKADLGAEVLGIATLDVGKPGHPAVLISTRTAPLLWTPGEKDAAPKALDFDKALAADLGVPGRCLVADLEGDGIPDILQPFAKGSLIYKGKALGAFAAPVKCAVALGSGRSYAFLGDFDADGLLDLVTVAEDGAGVWQNEGQLKFTETLGLSGEFAYKGNTGAIDGATCDFNNDGRQDVVFFYSGAYPALFFNRGFRSFGYSNGLDFERGGAPPEAANGQQAGCVADFDGDGAQELVMILGKGEAVRIPFETGGDVALAVRAELPAKGPYVGPLSVTGWRKDRCLGAWNVVAGSAEAFVARMTAGPVTLKWQFPGGKPQKKDVNLNGPARLVLEAGEK